MAQDEYEFAIQALERAKREVERCIEAKASSVEFEQAWTTVAKAEVVLDVLIEGRSQEERNAIWVALMTSDRHEGPVDGSHRHRS